MIRTLLAHYLITLITVLYTLAITLYVSAKFPAYTLAFLLFWLFGWLISHKIKEEHRHKGTLVIIVDIVFSLVFGYLLAYVFNHHQQLYALLSPNLRDVIERIMAILYNFVPNIFLNALLVIGIAYSVFLLPIRIAVIEHINSNKFNHPLLNYLFQIGYSQTQTAWRLFPHFLTIKPFAYLFLAYAGMVLAWYFWQGKQSMPMVEWVLWCVPFLIFLAVDWWIWLSGKVLEFHTSPNFWEEDNDTVINEHSFEELWRKYHKFWANKWLVAGNKTTGGKE